MTPGELQGWEARNRVKLYPGQLNRWVWVISQELARTDADVHRYLLGATNRVAGAKAADDFRVIRTSATRLAPKGGDVQTREQLQELPLPMVIPGPVTWAETEFAWRSPVTSAPWPAERFRFGLLAEQDPEQAELMLDSAGPAAGKAKPDRSPIADLIDDTLDAAVETPARAVGTGVVVLGLAYLVLRKLR